MMFNKTVTLYNTYEQDFTSRPIPKLLKGVHIELTEGSVAAAEGDRAIDRLFIVIPFNGLKTGFTPSYEYEAAEDKTGLWTLKNGDYVTVGDTGAAESHAALAARTRVFRIAEVKTLDFGSLPHWEVTAI